MGKRVLGVGHCLVDAPRIAKVVAELGATFENAETADTALARLREEPFDLVLPNRVLGADERGGLHLVEVMKNDAELASVPVMLVSGIPDAQQAAEAAGALPGFGKDTLESGGARDAMAKVLA